MSVSDTLLRQLAMLRQIPRHPQKTSAQTLQRQLTDLGYDIDLRSIQRDLNNLSQSLAIVSDGAKPQGWSWQADASQLDLPALDPQSALMFKLVEHYLHPLFPVTTLDYLQPWFNAASGVLDAHSIGLAQWPEKIRVLPQGQPQLAPRIDPAAQAILYQALLEERRVAVTYQRRGAEQPKEYIVSPLAIVVRDRLIYLVCTLWEYTDVRHLVLHRVRHAQLLDETFVRPPAFSLDEHIANGKFDFPVSSNTLLLEAEFSARAAGLLHESPLSEDQVISKLDERLLVRSTVHDTKELRWWLQSFGDEVTVLGPASLRMEFERTANNLAQQYAQRKSING